MTKRKIKTIGDIFESLSPFLVSIENNSDSLLPFLTLIFPKTWEVESYLFVNVTTMTNAFVYNVQSSEEFSIDMCISKTLDIIDYNQKLEEKQKKIEDIIRKKQDKLNKEIEKLKQELGGKMLELGIPHPIIPNTENVEEDINRYNHITSDKLIGNYIPRSPRNADNQGFNGIELVKDIQATPEGFEETNY